jgi:hypothetical protein
MKRTIRKLKHTGQELIIFGKFLYNGPEWERYGLEIIFSSDFPATPEIYTIKVTSYNDQDTIRAQQVIKLLGRDKFIFYNNVCGHIEILKFFVKAYRACRRVNKLKVYL